LFRAAAEMIDAMRAREHIRNGDKAALPVRAQGR